MKERKKEREKKKIRKKYIYCFCVPDFKSLKCVFSQIRSRFISDWRTRIHLRGKLS